MILSYKLYYVRACTYYGITSEKVAYNVILYRLLQYVFMPLA